MALAKQAGGSGYSANLSTNPSIRQQQLICDPAEPKAGSTSVLYDASLVTLVGYKPGPGYDNKGFLGYVELIKPGGNKILQPLSAFVGGGAQGVETGYVQVLYTLTGTAGQLSPDPGFTEVEHTGAIGIDTHGLKFQLKPGVPDNADVHYTVYAEYANRHTGNQQDFLQVNDGSGTILNPGDLTSANASSNRPPVIDEISPPQIIDEGSSLHLHALAHDPDNSGTLIYSWDINNDGVFDVTGSDPTISYSQLLTLGLGDGPAFSAIKVVVSDGTKSASASTSVTVQNVNPLLSLGAVSAINENGVATLSGTFSDPGTPDTFSLSIDWGDGSAATVLTYAAGAGSFTQTHRYVDDNPTATSSDVYTISATLTDDDTGATTRTTGVTVINVAPTFAGVTLLSSSIDENGSVTLSGTVNDVGPADVLGLVINWGDGSSNSTLNSLSPGQTFSLSHQYLDDNPTATSSDQYTISLTANDDDTGSVSTSRLVTVNNVAPTLTLNPVLAINENGTATLSGSIGDAGTQDTFVLTVDWGDGSLPVNYSYGVGASSFSVTHQYLDDNPTATSSDNYAISAQLKDDDTGTIAKSASVMVNNVAPTLSLNAVAAVNETGTATLSGTFADVGTLDSFVLSINWGDGSAASTYNYPAGSSTFSVSHQYQDDPPPGTPSDSLTISATLTDDDSGSINKTTAVTVNNIKPTVAITSLTCNTSAVATLQLSANDVSAADRAAGFSYLIDWGDGTQTINPTANNGAGISVTHSYSILGVVTVTVRSVDKDTGTSDPASATIVLSGVKMLPDPSSPSSLALWVVGTDAADTVKFAKSGGGLAVTMNNVNMGTFKGFTRVIALGLGGNDNVQLFDASGIFFGGDGSDTLIAGNTGSILDGGAGDDSLVSGTAKDLLVGGFGKDSITGGDGVDLLVAGATAYDTGTKNDIIALTGIFNEWVSNHGYDQSIAYITGQTAGGLNGTSVFKQGVTVWDDGVADQVFGGNGKDWILAHTIGGVTDTTDASAGEVVTQI